MRKRKFFVRILFVLFLFLITNTLFAFISYHATGWLYGQLGTEPHDFWQQLGTVLGVFVLFACSYRYYLLNWAQSTTKLLGRYC
ncbi:hypothetical protein AABM34_07880 [Lysinibacillus fusiformis]